MLNLFELEIFNKLFWAAAEEMCITVERAAHTTFVRETNDFCASLATRDGWFFTYPRRLGGTSFLALHLGSGIDAINEYEPGDVILTNDPYETKGLSTHLPDLHVFAPIFAGNEIICFSWGFVHSADVGGRVDGSISPSSRTIFEEGLRIPPSKLFRRGTLNQELVDLVLANVRSPQKTWGDLNALVSAMHVGNRKINALVAKYGRDTIEAAIQGLLDHSERRARTIISSIPDGVYSFSDYLEDDVVSDVPIKLCLAMRIAGDEIHLDYSGTDPQVSSAFNVPTFGKVHAWLTLALIRYMLTEEPETPLNAGLIRPLSVNLPSGSVVNPVFPAAVGVRSTTAARLFDITLGALNEAVPGKTPAAGAGQGLVVVLSIPDYRTGKRRINAVEPMIGGTGARPQVDGYDGVDFPFGFARTTPVEVLEADTRILVREYGLIPDSGGAGKFRGGLGVVLEFQVLSPDAVVTGRGMERTRFRPWGVRGGRPGRRTEEIIINPGKGSERRISKIDVERLQLGDIVRVASSGGGGYGDPFERDVEAVLRDVQLGFVSPNGASEYGVYLRPNGELDVDKTSIARAAQRRQEEIVTFDEERKNYDRFWNDDVRSAVQEWLDSVPVLLRSEIRGRLHHGLLSASGKGRKVPTRADVDTEWKALKMEME